MQWCHKFLLLHWVKMAAVHERFELYADYTYSGLVVFVTGYKDGWSKFDRILCAHVCRLYCHLHSLSQNECIEVFKE